jgi:hypothetical protein
LVKRDILIILAVVLLIRLPFLNQAVQGDDSLFLTSAAHALTDPLHPNHTHYFFTFVGLDVDFRGNPHPPMNAWFLALLLAIVGEVKEVPFHAAYMGFSILAALAMYALARRFSPSPLLATLLFLAVPAFVVNGGSLEADVPHLAFFLAGMAGFIWGVDHRSPLWLALGGLSFRFAALTLIQAQLAIPILFAYAWWFGRDWRPAWFKPFSIFVTLAVWEIFERVTSGVFPFAVTAGYLHQQAWDRLVLKFVNAAGLSIHLWFIVFPLLFAAGVWAAWQRRQDRDTVFLAAWIGIFFAGCCILPFFSGSARYLLPIAAPVAILASFVDRKWIAGGFALQMTLSLCLAVANYQHWDAYRGFGRQVVKQAAGRRLWINSEWGLRHYMEDAGARVPKVGQFIPSGDVVVWSELVQTVRLEHPQEMVAPLMEQDVRPWMPFRLIGLESSSGYSSIQRGFAPFGVGWDLVDRIHADIYREAKPTLTNLPMNAPEAGPQIVSGIFDLEDKTWRWMSATATVVLVSPKSEEPLHAKIDVPGNVPARRISVMLDGKTVYSQAIAPGMQRIVTPPLRPAGPAATVSLQVDQTFSPPGDARQLGVVLHEIGWGK